MITADFGNLQGFGAAAAAVNQAQTGGVAAAVQPRQRVRARRGQATDPHSIAERVRQFLFLFSIFVLFETRWL